MNLAGLFNPNGLDLTVGLLFLLLLFSTTRLPRRFQELGRALPNRLGAQYGLSRNSELAVIAFAVGLAVLIGSPLFRH